ncbi:hypothetical protein BC830DRAFT_1091502 [Chytriomyces sp. MP71]|nr:hypothetical protein BC830DRAFT_1091502 [Chytriomyces sp. MP71]
MPTSAAESFDFSFGIDLTSFDTIGADLGPSRLGRASWENLKSGAHLAVVDAEIAAILEREANAARSREENTARERATAEAAAEWERMKSEAVAQAERESGSATTMATSSVAAIANELNNTNNTHTQMHRKDSLASNVSDAPSVVSSRTQSVATTPAMRRSPSAKSTATTNKGGFMGFFKRGKDAHAPPPSAAPSPTPFRSNSFNSPKASSMPQTPTSIDTPSLSRTASIISPDGTTGPPSLARDVSNGGAGAAPLPNPRLRMGAVATGTPSPRMSVSSSDYVDADTLKMSHRGSSSTIRTVQDVRLSRMVTESPKLEIVLPTEDDGFLSDFKF